MPARVRFMRGVAVGAIGSTSERTCARPCRRAFLLFGLVSIGSLAGRCERSGVPAIHSGPLAQVHKSGSIWVAHAVSGGKIKGPFPPLLAQPRYLDDAFYHESPR